MNALGHSEIQKSFPRVLVVEDDDFKREKIEEALTGRFEHMELTLAGSVQDALVAINRGRFDLIVLDISLPSRSAVPGGGAPMSLPSGGLEVLYELDLNERTDAVVVLTQYPDIELDGETIALNLFRQHVSKEISTNIIDVIYFDHSSERWKIQMLEAI